MAKKPNILFILSDQHNAKVLGHKGHPDVKTPNLDRMAEEGVRFDNAITQNPICTPSRVSFLSGQYCHNHGYYGLSGPRPEGLPSILSHFRHFGYRTAAIGKIHCPENWIEDHVDVYHDTGDTSVNGRSPSYTRFLERRGVADQEDHLALPEFEDGLQSMDSRPSLVSYEESQEGWIAQATIDVMRAAKSDAQPFCVHASLPRPHQVTTPAQEFWDLYDEDSLTLPPNADYEMCDQAPHLVEMREAWANGNWAKFEPKTFDAARLRKLHGYLGAVSQIDHAVGQMLDFLREEDLDQETIVVYSSDHGEYVCEHGIMEKAPGICHDATTRVPLLWWSPGLICKNLHVSALAEAVDVSQTLCSLAGLEPLETSDGEDLSRLLRGAEEDVKRLAVTELPWSRSVRKGEYRFVWYAKEFFPEEYPDGFGELYNLEEDPWEMTNLFFRPDHADKVAEMREDLLNWLITTTRPVTVHQLNSEFRATNWQRRYRYFHQVNRDGKVNPDRIRREVTIKNYL